MAKMTKQKVATKKKPNVKLVLARVEDVDSREGLAAFYEQLVGRRPTEAELDEAFADEEEGGDGGS